MPSPLGDKIRDLRKKQELSLEQLADQTESSKSYIWELENKADPKPCADNLAKIAAALKVTTDFLLTESAAAPDQEVKNQAFFRKYRALPPETKKKLDDILKIIEGDDK